MSTDSSATEPTMFQVQGMSCGHCVAAVTDEVGAVAGVTSVNVDLDQGLVAVIGGDPEAIVAAIDEAGFDASEPVEDPGVL